ncbi:precorrin-2 C20-methyltransferase /cobalt-factor II C20-methyltransferase [Pseudonocardia thermophila]|jgi:Precorrin-2 methylase|uniref:Precorrin-2 C20-methyltransferase /cobalt-factor II C20-methyltransferase n=1 Tax=Pseudonocardia thermophila TaxID=1848 RepID=A0A1M6PJR9_PSETH|nr:precorrin-2 C(20)-methyltransferase [Pseudonocardia thermophila]SHK08170.1 precorrin-2 C20-methyltransferase /cobalt-factor II C20-methyltransferase [Pseudonocardia thermophila]
MYGNEADLPDPVPFATLIGVGVGPGDPDLVTFQAVDTLTKADVVFVPVVSPEETGRAEQVVLGFVEAWRVDQVVFPHDAGDGPAAWDAAVAHVADWLLAHPGAVAAYATTGDPGMHSAFPAFARAVAESVPGLEITFVPGITPMQAIAARRGEPIVEPGESLAVLAGPPDEERLRESLATFDRVVAERVGPKLPAALAELATADRLDGAVVGAVGGPRGPQLHDAASLPADARLPYLSTLVVPARRRTEATR